MSKNTKKKLAAVMFCKFDDYDSYVNSDKKLAVKILGDYDKVVNKNGIKIIGIGNVMNKLPLTASNLYAKNIFSFIRNLYSREKKQFILNMEDEIIKSTLIKEGS